MIIAAAILAAVFPKLVEMVMNREIALREGGRTFNWWREPPVSPRISVYIFNVTNADEFLNDGEKPALNELGPYVYVQQWEKVEVKFNENDTVSYKVKKRFTFAPVSFSFRIPRRRFVSSRSPSVAGGFPRWRGNVRWFQVA